MVERNRSRSLSNAGHLGERVVDLLERGAAEGCLPLSEIDALAALMEEAA
jgi:hypothetical protein